MSSAKSEFLQAQKVLQDFISDDANFSAIENAAGILVSAFQNGNKVISCGNGGSMCDAMHLAEELSGRFRNNRKALPAMAVSDPSYLTCAANDYGYKHVFSRYVEAFGKNGDVLFAISTSGNSENIIEAAGKARELGMKIIALTGNNGGALASQCDAEIRVPHNGYADRIQEVHIKIIHTMIMLVEESL